IPARAAGRGQDVGAAGHAGAGRHRVLGQRAGPHRPARSDEGQYPRANFASSLIMSGVHGGENVIVDFTLSTPSSSPTYSLICSVTCGPIGQPGEVRVKVTSTSPPSTSTS